MHGAGAAALGILCDVIRAVQPCSADVTPTANMMNFPGPVYTYACTQSGCGAGHNSMTGTITIVP